MKSPKQQRAPRRRFWRFLLVSSVTGLICLGTFWLIQHWCQQSDRIGEQAAVLIAEGVSVILSCIFSFLLNSKFTFTDRKARRMGILLYILYYVISTPLFAEMMVWLNGLGVHILLCKVIKMTINFAMDYLYCKYFIFRYIRRKYDAEAKADDIIQEIKEMAQGGGDE